MSSPQSRRVRTQPQPQSHCKTKGHGSQRCAGTIGGEPWPHAWLQVVAAGLSAPCQA